MEPILNEHEVVKFLVAKGGRCTNFELVSNFRGVLNDPHCKAEARLRFKDIINTVASVGEFQNVKYIELKRDSGPNIASDSFPPQPSSLSSDCGSSYASPLSQNFQPYWRYRLSTSKQQQLQPQISHHRSVSEYALEQPTEDQVVPCQLQEADNHFSGDFSDDSGQTTQSLPFYNTRSRAVSEPPSHHHRRFSSSDGFGLGQHHENQPHGNKHLKNQLSSYPHHDHQLPGYQYHENQLAGYQHHQRQPHGNKHLENQNIENQRHDHQFSTYQLHGHQFPGYQHHENQPNDYRGLKQRPEVLQELQQAGYQHFGQQSYEVRNTRHQDTKSQQVGQQHREPQSAGYHHSGCQQLEYWNTGQQDARFQKAGQQYLEYQQQPYHHNLPAGNQSQHLRQDLRQQANEKHLKPYPDVENNLEHRNPHRPGTVEPRVQRSSSGRRSGDSFRESEEEVSRTKPESSFSRRIESLHGIRASDTSRDYSSLPYESPSAYSISDISPKNLAAEDIQTSANIRNVARALFKDPSKTSRRTSYDHRPRSEDINSNLVGLPNAISSANHTQISNTHSSYKYVDNTKSSSKRQSFGTVGLPDRPGYLSEKSCPGRVGVMNHVPSKPGGPGYLSESSIPGHVGSVDHVPSIPYRSGNMDSGRVNNNSNRSGFPDSNCTTDPHNPNHSRLEDASPRTSSNSSPRSLVDRSSSSIHSRHSSSMLSLNSEKELSNSSAEIERSGTPPPPLPPDRRKKLLPTSDDNSVDNNALEHPVSCSGGKVKDRVQHFDDMEKQRRNTKRTHSPLTPLANKENSRIHHKGLGHEDDVSISVIDPKLRREWFVKSSQCDYHVLSGLLKKEPKLAALRDSVMGYTALHWAAKQGDANVVKLIAGTYKVNPNVRSNGGYTPVHLATLYKHDMIVHLLVHTYGADPSVRDYSGKRADQYPSNYVKVVAGHKVSERRPLKQRPPEPQPQQQKEAGSSFMRIGSLNLRKSSRKSAVFASVRGSTRNWGSASELRLGGHSSMRKKLHKSMISAPERIGELEKKNDSDSDSTYGFFSKKQDN